MGSIRFTVRVGYQRVQAYLSGAPQRSEEVMRLWRQQGKEETIGFMRGIVPVKSGFLRESITSKETPKGFSVYPTAKYGKIVDQGSKPHTIFPSSAKVLRWYSPFGAPIFAAHVKHPGTKGLFFMRRTREGMRQVLKQLYKLIYDEVN